ncbi:hypothetical protein PRIPAC_70108 [Pristionchus pacificus]|uniref:Uncharacterized protein n=1 Tax=Pristionchus pacificus TaxID=54126 RepID=A0A2A6BGK8_PRIPA|nr:hypothetical protein PRIPAC_70108 [Pristionchus pacificus]|eukprot:PDM64993.1 hypothetical protein PRIPAC_53249 [Pristionchus pacificus]
MQPSIFLLLLLSSVFIANTTAKPWDINVLLQWINESLEETIRDLDSRNTSTSSTSATYGTTTTLPRLARKSTRRPVARG